jgi:hypothetical protein
MDIIGINETQRKEAARDVRNGAYELTDENELYLPRQSLLVGGHFGSEVLNAQGEVIQPYEEGPNIIVNEGLNHILNAVLHGETQVDPWYVGIYKANVAIVAGTTGATVASLVTEIAAGDVDETVRETYVEAESTAQSTTNSASKASYTSTGTMTIYGAFLISTAAMEDTAGILLAGSLFGSSRALVVSDELLVTYTLNATST